MKIFTYSLKAVFFLLLATPAYADNDFKIFNNIFKEWTQAFNHKNLAKTCDLFSPSLEANYEGHHRNYQTVCAGLKKAYLEKNNYKYHFKLHHVYRCHDLAAVRITWYFLEYEGDKLKSVTQDEGIDIFKKNKQGKWEIVNYVAYGV